MPTAAKVDLTSFLADCSSTVTSAINYISDAQKAQKTAADKCARVLAPASLAASESSSAKAIFQEVDAQQDAVVAAGLDPAKIFGGLLNQAAQLAQSAKSRLVDAGAAAAA